MNKLLLAIILIFSLAACGHEESHPQGNIIFNYGGDPFITAADSMYYLTLQTPTVDSIIIFRSPALESIHNGESKMVWPAKKYGMANIYAPEIHRIGKAWYIYFEADNGVNTDNHQLFVLENPSPDPFEGEWTLHGPVITDQEWNFGLHPTTVSVSGKLYLLWSGWPKRRTETETQCIYIAEMENPWTLKSERVMISSPEYEWERQWINPDGSRTAYPIYVNENPAAMISPDNKTIVVGYSASGIWTVYNSLGILHARTDSDLLDPASWTKEPEPFFVADEESGLFGTSNISVTPAIDREGYIMVYQTKKHDDNGNILTDIRHKRISWDKNGLPDFGKP